MSTTFDIYANAGLTTALTAGIPFAQVASGSATDVLVYFGSQTPGKTLQAASSPGFDQITLTPDDVSSGSGVETSMIRLASTALGLDSATPGAAINLGVTLTSGDTNAIPVWIRVDAGALAVSGTPYTDGLVKLNPVIET
ncbi:hypothetical protein [Denitromonas halophila]|uniref:Uncharacterized protein n=1 Tax=Denitromonas halophila TaxID=1629404 RepID=A0A557QLT2_9RHOO|nr:hypothetical protein [Denitromonas halophila]TVO53862.1 hypothetical protein FHP91_13780 [Denitromonas halophila]